MLLMIVHHSSCVNLLMRRLQLHDWRKRFPTILLLVFIFCVQDNSLNLMNGMRKKTLLENIRQPICCIICVKVEWGRILRITYL